eukprot:3367848-Rhodomonas_salina.2
MLDFILHCPGFTHCASDTKRTAPVTRTLRPCQNMGCVSASVPEQTLDPVTPTTQHRLCTNAPDKHPHIASDVQGFSGWYETATSRNPGPNNTKFNALVVQSAWRSRETCIDSAVQAASNAIDFNPSTTCAAIRGN